MYYRVDFVFKAEKEHTYAYRHRCKGEWSGHLGCATAIVIVRGHVRVSKARCVLLVIYASCG